MQRTFWCTKGIVTAPHHLAAQSGLAVLREGGSAVEAMVAAAATIAVVYPQMNGLGGDGFWLIKRPGEAPRAIMASGRAGAGATRAFYRDRGAETIPVRGPLAALTVAGTVSGWVTALGTVAGRTQLPPARLLADAIGYARDGFPVSDDQTHRTADTLSELRDVPGFAATFLIDGAPPASGALLRQPRLAGTLERLAEAGLDDFYHGDVAASIARDLQRLGAPVTLDDLRRHAAAQATPLSVRLDGITVFNTPPPTQGLASLAILGLFARLEVGEPDGFAHVHGLVEATKRAFLLRDRYITDPDFMALEPSALLSDARLDQEAAAIDRERAAPWPQPAPHADTVWLGAIDRDGLAVSFIQSLYWMFGSGVVLPETGILWQNRGASFALAPDAPNALAPGRRPFHTLNPALALFDDGRVMVYGTQGADGQPQSQAAIFSRYALFGQDLQAAIQAPRWVLGRTWGAPRSNLRIENRFDPAVIDQLRAAGHDVELVAPISDVMGQSGALVRHRDGRLAGATDPRSDGVVATA